MRRAARLGVLAASVTWAAAIAGAEAAPRKKPAAASDKTRAPEAKKMKSYSIGRIQFDAPTDGVQVKEVGVNTWEAAVLDPGKAGERGAWVTFVVPDKSELEAAGGPAEQMQQVKATYLGTTKPAEKPVEREVMGRKVKGEWQQAKIPKPLVLETYRVELPAGEALFVGLRRAEAFSTEMAEAFFKQVASTLKVAPGDTH